MSKLLWILVFGICAVGCRAAVPVSFADKMRKHNQNVQEFHGLLQGYLKAEIAAVESRILVSDGDVESLRFLKAYWEEKLFYVHCDAQMSEVLERWAIRHQWKLAMSASE